MRVFCLLMKYGTYYIQYMSHGLYKILLPTLLRCNIFIVSHFINPFYLLISPTKLELFITHFIFVSS